MPVSFNITFSELYLSIILILKEGKDQEYYQYVIKPGHLFYKNCDFFNQYTFQNLNQEILKILTVLSLLKTEFVLYYIEVTSKSDLNTFPFKLISNPSRV